MKSRINHAGIAHLAAIAVVLLLGVVGFAGYKVVSMNKAADSASSVVADSSAPESITTKADLAQTEKALENTSAGLDSGLNDSALDADLNDML